MAATKKSTKEEGVVWLSSTGDYYVQPEIDADKLYDFSKGYYGAGVAQKQRNLIFTDRFTLGVIDPKGDPDEDLAKRMTMMCSRNDVRLWSRMQQAFDDCFWFGMSFFNPVWGRDGAEYTLNKLRHLPAHSFADEPAGNFSVRGQILEGVVLNNKNIEYYQTSGDGALPTQLKNIFTVKDPTSTEIAGSPIVIPIVPIISMLKFSWQAQMQKINRVGAPILFLKITNPKGDDIEFGNKILQNWGKNTAFQLRENMELIDPGITDNTTALDTIEILNRMIVDYFSPSSLISKDGTLLGGSSASEQQLTMSYIRGIQSWVEDAFEQLLQVYLDVNGYVDYHVEIHIPVPDVDRSEIQLQQAIEGAKARTIHPNEFRELIGHESIDDSTLADIRTAWETLAPPSPSPFGMMAIQNAETQKQVERKEKKSLEDALDALAVGVLQALAEEEEGE